MVIKRASDFVGMILAIAIFLAVAAAGAVMIATVANRSPHLPRRDRLKVSNSSEAPCDERHLRQTAIVTGAASSIGLAIATALAEAGANVVMADIQKDGSKRQRTVSPGRTNARPPPGA